MEFGQYQLQIFVSLVVILGAAFVALICDFLKGNNEQLRELTIELKVRREEEQNRSQMMTARSMESLAAHAKPSRSPQERIEAPAEGTSSEKATHAHPVPRALANPVEHKRTIAPEAVAAMERGAQLAGAPRRSKPVPPPVPQEAARQTTQTAHVAPEVRVPVARTEKTETTPGIYRTENRPALAVRAGTSTQSFSAPSSFTLSREPVVIVEPVELRAASEESAKPASAAAKDPAAKKDWNALLSSRRGEGRHVTPVVEIRAISEKSPASTVRPAVEVREDLLNAVLAATASPVSSQASQASSSVPAGFHEGLVLSRLVESRQPVSGLVVSIGVSTGRKGETSIPEPVRQLVQSLIGPDDFACQSDDDEFLLIYPNERGASAQRRLSALAQQLWDFQLRSLGNFSILFSWGGVEVRSESIDEAVASASERMQETKRGRKVLTMEPAPAEDLRQAV